MIDYLLVYNTIYKQLFYWKNKIKNKHIISKYQKVKYFFKNKEINLIEKKIKLTNNISYIDNYL